MALLTALAACSDPDDACEADCEAGMVCDSTIGECVVEADEACESGAAWEPGESAFEDASADWGLDESGANGQRLSVTDLDGDGYADLSVRRAGTTSGDDFSSDSREDRVSWLFENDGGEGFEDVTQESGLVQSRSGGDDEGRAVDTIVWADVDNDGDLDAYTSFNRSNSTDDEEADTAELMLNDGDGNFEFADDDTLRRLGEPDSPGGASFVDVDRDGSVDLWVSQYADSQGPLQDRLYVGDGDGVFEEATEDAGLQTEAWQSLEDLNEARGHSVSWGANACDLNGDGAPELLASSYGRAPNHLWLADGGEGLPSYDNHSIDSGYAFDERTDWTDNESARCYCEHNPDAADCDGVPEPEHIACENDENLRWNHDQDREPFRLGGNSGTTVCADVDNDGRLDLLTTEIRHWDVGSSSDPSELLFNEGGEEPTFERPGREETGLTREREEETGWDEGDITAAVFDFDNDGRQDVYIGSTDYAGTRGHLYHQQDDGTFEEVSVDDGIDHTSSHGVAVADFDRDGDLDLAVGHSRNRCGTGEHCYSADEGHVRLFENTAGDAQNWLQVDLEGADGTNRAAIGAQVTVETDDSSQTFEVDGGHGHYGIQHDLVQHAGLGEACHAEVTVRWPDEELSEETYTMRAGHRYKWKQGEVPTAIN